MKTTTKIFLSIAAVLFIVVLGVIFLQEKSSNSPVVVKQVDDTTNRQDAVVENDTAILQLTKSLLILIKKKDYVSLANLFHPVEGVRFSPYAYISNEDIRLTQDQFLLKLKAATKLNWGSYDGSGDPIVLTVPNYFGKFIYNADFLNAEQLNVDTSLAYGNSVNNIENFYKNAVYTESYFSGFDKSANGMDWTALRLVYKKHQNKYYVVAIIHDQWTI